MLQSLLYSRVYDLQRKRIWIYKNMQARTIYRYMHMVHVHIIGQSNKLHVLLLKQGQYRIWMRVLQILDRLGVNYITANPAGSDKLLIY